MFYDIGGKIKIMAYVIFWGGLLLSFFAGFGAVSNEVFMDESTILWFVIYVLVGSLLSWGASLLVYGFGQLIENTDNE